MMRGDYYRVEPDGSLDCTQEYEDFLAAQDWEDTYTLHPTFAPRWTWSIEGFDLVAEKRDGFYLIELFLGQDALIARCFHDRDEAERVIKSLVRAIERGDLG